MDKRSARLRSHQANIERYESLMKTDLSEVELQYIERRLFQERFAMVMLDFMSPPKGPDVPRAHE